MLENRDESLVVTASHDKLNRANGLKWRNPDTNAKPRFLQLVGKVMGGNRQSTPARNHRRVFAPG